MSSVSGERMPARRGSFRMPQGPALTRAALIAGAVVLVLALVGGLFGVQIYHKLTTTTVVAYFRDTLALYPGDKVTVMGVRIGQIESIEPTGDRMKVTFRYNNSTKVPANANATVLNPSLVTSRTIQLSPPTPAGRC